MNNNNQCYFYWQNFAKKRIFFTSDLFLARFGLKKNILVAKNSSILTIFIHITPIFIHFGDVIQHVDELALEYVSAVSTG